MSARDHMTRFRSINLSSSFLETRRQMKQFRRRTQVQRNGETENALVITSETRAVIFRRFVSKCQFRLASDQYLPVCVRTKLRVEKHREKLRGGSK